MEKRYLKFENGIYSADIDITVSEWKEMLQNEAIFDETSKKMIGYWYHQTDCQATTKEIMIKYNIPEKGTPFNGIVKGLGIRIIKHLNRFEVIGTDGNKSYFIIPFEGWHVDYDESKNFVWKLRDELITAIEELDYFQPATIPLNDDYENIGIIERTPEGKAKVSYTTKFERNPKNRRQAIRIHGAKCQICGFDFEQVYGERGKGFIEVHHIHPLYESQEEVVIDPKEDLICVCSNCHRMFHRKKDKVPTPEELKKSINTSLVKK